MCDIAVKLRKPENALHKLTSQVTTKMGSARTSHLRKLRPHIASHALQNRKETLTLCTVWQTTKFIREKTAPGCNEIIAVGKQTKQIILCFLTRFRLVKCVGVFYQ